MNSPSLTSTITLTSHSTSPAILPSNFVTPSWTTHILSTDSGSLWIPTTISSPNRSDFLSLFPIPIPSPSSLTITSSSCTIDITTVLSVDAPVYCHQLCSFPSLSEHSTLITAVTDPHLAIPFNYYFNDGCPFEALYEAYLQVEYLRIIINSLFTTKNSITLTIKHITHDIQTYVSQSGAHLHHAPTRHNQFH